jgi:hypothetical protein
MLLLLADVLCILFFFAAAVALFLEAFIRAPRSVNMIALGGMFTALGLIVLSIIEIAGPV